jgi:hypothetical protein
MFLEVYVSKLLEVYVVKTFRFLSLVIALTLCLPAMAQSTTGTISGRVIDPQGAVVPGAAVTVTSTTTNVAHAVTTNQDGLYAVPLLLPGEYTISVVTPSFRKEVRNNLTLQIGQVLETDFNLSVGTTTETVTVSTAAPIIQTQSAAVGAVVDQQKIEEIPLNGRQYYSLGMLVPGAMPPAYNSSLSYRGGINLAGQQEISTFYTLDGLNNQDTVVNSPTVVPSVEDIQEFKIYTGVDFEAEYGHQVGGNIVVTSRSGGNAYHGDIYEFLRNQIFDAKNFFQNNGTKLSYKRNDFGGTFGGHIIPNKMFFFFSAEFLILHNQYTALSTIPDAAQIGGNFTGEAPLIAPTGYDPGVINTTNNSINVAAMTPAQVAAYNVGAALLSYYPVVTASGANNYTFNAPATAQSKDYQVRFDNDYNAKNTSYATLNWYTFPQTTPGNVTCSASSIPGFDCHTSVINQLYGGGWTHIFTPNVINNLVVGYNRDDAPRSAVDNTIPFDSTWNIPTFQNPAISGDGGGVPFTSINGFSTYGTATNLTQIVIENTYDFNDNVLWNIGSHSFTFGGEYTLIRVNSLQVNYAAGEFIFNGTYTGNPVADALLGLPTEAQRNNQANATEHLDTKYIAGFAEDSWKITPSLTLNYGVRWEGNTPFTSGNTEGGGFNFTTGTPFTYGANGISPHFWHAYNNGWGPRLGLSYRPFKSDRTVLQAGFGTSYDSIPTNSALNVESSYPERVQQNTFGSAAAPISLPNPWPNISTVSGAAVQGVSPHMRPAQANAYTLGVEQKLTQSIVLTLNYQGQETAHIYQNINLNQSLPQLTAALGNSSRPYSLYSTASQLTARGHANYNALYAKLQQNMNHGLSYLISFTYGKTEDDAELEGGTVQNIHDFKSEKGLAAYDVRHRLVASPVYELPFGPGRQFLNQGWASRIVGNWEVAGEIALQNGTPVNPEDGANVSNNGETSGDRPFVTGNPNNFHHHIAEWFNVLDYNYQNVVAAPPVASNQQLNSFPGVTVVPPTPQPYGNARNGSIQSPGYEDVDLNVARTFALPRKMSMQFRAQFYDAFNEPQFEQPSGTFTGFTKNATTGVVSAKGSFGKVTQANGARNIEFALKLFF